MSKNVYFLNDFQKSAILGRFPILDIYFIDFDNKTHIILNNSKLPDCPHVVCSSAEREYHVPNSSSFNDYVFVKKSVDEIIKKIESCIDNFEL